MLLACYTDNPWRGRGQGRVCRGRGRGRQRRGRGHGRLRGLTTSSWSNARPSGTRRMPMPSASGTAQCRTAWDGLPGDGAFGGTSETDTLPTLSWYGRREPSQSVNGVACTPIPREDGQPTFDPHCVGKARRRECSTKPQWLRGGPSKLDLQSTPRSSSELKSSNIWAVCYPWTITMAQRFEQT